MNGLLKPFNLRLSTNPVTLVGSEIDIRRFFVCFIMSPISMSIRSSVIGCPRCRDWDQNLHSKQPVSTFSYFPIFSTSRWNAARKGCRSNFLLSWRRIFMLTIHWFLQRRWRRSFILIFIIAYLKMKSFICFFASSVAEKSIILQSKNFANPTIAGLRSNKWQKISMPLIAAIPTMNKKTYTG